MVAEDSYGQFRQFLAKHQCGGPEFWAAVEPCLTIRNLKKGDFFYRPIDETKPLGFINHGLLRTFFINDHGQEFTTEFCSQGDITVNYDILQGQAPGNIYSQALESSQLLMLSVKAFVRLSRDFPVIANLAQQLQNHYYAGKLKREQNLVSMGAEEKYRDFLDTRGALTGRIPQYLIASYLGISPETLSRIKK